MKPSFLERVGPYRKAIVAAVASLASVVLAVIWQLDPDTVPGLAAQIGALLSAVVGPILVYAVRDDTPQPPQSFFAADLGTTFAELKVSEPPITSTDVAHGLALLRRIAASLNQLSTNAHLGELLRRQQRHNAARKDVTAPGTHPTPPPPVAGPSTDPVP